MNQYTKALTGLALENVAQSQQPKPVTCLVICDNVTMT